MNKFKTMRHDIFSPEPKRFTLVEMLVVMALLMILVSMLQPSLKSALNSARITKCLSNLKDLGHAVNFYLEDNHGYYPLVKANGYGYQSGGYADGETTYGTNVRPLNYYLNYDPTISECPADKGDSIEVTSNCYQKKGSSYVGASFRDTSIPGKPRVQHVFRHNYPVNIRDLPYTSNKNMSNKIILGDWPWYPDRSLVDPESRWHFNDARKYNILFGDGHSKLFDFDIADWIRDSYW